MIVFKMLNKKWSEDRLGFIPMFLDERNPAPAAQQFNEQYAHGGGWSPMTRWHHLGKYKIYFPGDPTMMPGAMAQFRDEVICIYDHAWVGIFQPDGKFEISRMD